MAFISGILLFSAAVLITSTQADQNHLGDSCTSADIQHMAPSTILGRPGHWTLQFEDREDIEVGEAAQPVRHCCKKGDIAYWRVALTQKFEWVGSFSAICSDGEELPAIESGYNGTQTCPTTLQAPQEVKNYGNNFYYQVGLAVEGLMFPNAMSGNDVVPFSCPSNTVALGIHARSQCLSLVDVKILCGKSRQSASGSGESFAMIVIWMVVGGVCFNLILTGSIFLYYRINRPKPHDYERGEREDGVSLPLIRRPNQNESTDQDTPVTEMPFFQGLHLVNCPDADHMTVTSTKPKSFDSLPKKFKDSRIAPSDLAMLTPSGQPVILGEGGFGRVLKAHYMGSPVAVKVLKNGGHESTAQFLHEISILERIRFSCIVRFYGFSLYSNCLVLVMAYMENGDLFQRINKLKDTDMQWHKKGRTIMYNVAMGLKFLHQRVNIGHMDMKSPNILLNKDNEACIADVGLGKLITDSKAFVSAPASESPPWRAPERAQGICGFPSDIFAFGVICWEVCKLKKPYEGKLEPLNCPDDCPAEVKKMINKCLLKDPDLRPTAFDICEWFKAF